MIEIKQCPICGGDKLSLQLTCTDHSITKETFDLNLCETCRLIITSPQPEPTEIDKYYLSDVYTSHSKSPNSAIDKLYMMARFYTLSWKINMVTKGHARTSKTFLLDYGCGTGGFMAAAKSKGLTTYGVEPSGTAITNANEHVKKDIQASLNELPNNLSFDIITLWHVLEHVQNLDATIDRLKKLLKDDGTMYIAVPNHKTWEEKHFKQYWAGYDVPRHLWHFSKESIEILAKKHSLKIRAIVPMWLDAIYISLLSQKYARKDKLSILSALKGLSYGILSNLNGLRTNEFSSHVYVIKK